MSTRAALLSTSLIVCLFLTGCFDEVGGPYDGPDRIAFAQPQGNTSFALATEEESGAVGIPTQLIGSQRSNSFDVSVAVQQDTVFRERVTDQGDGTDTTIVDVRALPTTADDSDYSIPTSFTFPADTSNVSFDIQIQDAFDNAAPSGSTERLTLRLEPNDGENIEVAENWRYFEVTIFKP